MVYAKLSFSVKKSLDEARFLNFSLEKQELYHSVCVRLCADTALEIDSSLFASHNDTVVRIPYHMVSKLLYHVQQCYSFSCAICSQAEGEEDPLTKKRSNHAQRKIDGRKQFGKLDQHLEEQFTTGRLYGMLASGEIYCGMCVCL